MHRSSVVVLLLLALFASRAGAPPPVSGFPAELRPDGTGAVPANTLLWVFGEDAPPLAQVGVTVSVDGQPADVVLSALGCCGALVELGAALAEGDEVDVLVTAAGGEVNATFSVDTAADLTPPSSLTASVLDDAPGLLVLGVEGTDDVALAGYLAKAGGSVVGAAPTGFTLSARRGSARCVDVVAVDLAGNESEALLVCSELPVDEDPDDPPIDDGGCSCGQSRAAPLWLALTGLLLVRGRVRRSRAR